jgi:hypothetical protein
VPSKANRKRSMSEIFADNRVMNRAVRSGVREALEQHRRAGNKVAVLRDGKVVKIDLRKVRT